MTRILRKRKTHHHGLERLAPYAGGAVHGMPKKKKRKILSKKATRTLLKAAKATAATTALGIAGYAALPYATALAPESAAAMRYIGRGAFTAAKGFGRTLAGVRVSAGMSPGRLAAMLSTPTPGRVSRAGRQIASMRGLIRRTLVPPRAPVMLIRRDAVMRQLPQKRMMVRGAMSQAKRLRLYRKRFRSWP